MKIIYRDLDGRREKEARSPEDALFEIFSHCRHLLRSAQIRRVLDCSPATSIDRRESVLILQRLHRLFGDNI